MSLSFFSKIGSAIKKAAIRVFTGKEARAVETELKELAVKAVNAIVSKHGLAIVQTAKELVFNLVEAATNLETSGAEKNKIVSDQFRDAFKDVTSSFGQADINLLIDIALKQIQK